MAHLRKGADGHLVKIASGHLATVPDECISKKCWARWKYTNNCGTGANVLELLEVVCLDEDETLPYTDFWHRVPPYFCPCVFRLDEELEESCTDAGDCPEEPEEPDEPVTLCCAAVCVFSWTVTCEIDVGCGVVTEDGAECVAEEDFDDLILDRWVQVGDATGDVCTYRYSTAGECCESVGECVFPEAPEPPTGWEEACAACQEYVPDLIRVDITGTTGFCHSELVPEYPGEPDCWNVIQDRGTGNFDGSFTMSGATVTTGLHWVDTVSVSAGIESWRESVGFKKCDGCDVESIYYCGARSGGPATIGVDISEAPCQASVYISCEFEDYICDGGGWPGGGSGEGGLGVGECGTCCRWAEQYEGTLEGNAAGLHDLGSFTVTILDCPDELP